MVAGMQYKFPPFLLQYDSAMCIDLYAGCSGESKKKKKKSVLQAGSSSECNGEKGLDVEWV